MLEKYYYKLRKFYQVPADQIVKSQILVLNLISEILNQNELDNFTDILPDSTCIFLIQHLYGLVATIGTAPYQENSNLEFAIIYQALIVVIEMFCQITAYLHSSEQLKEIFFNEGLAEILLSLQFC
jgi:hypothetical protein